MSTKVTNINAYRSKIDTVLFLMEKIVKFIYNQKSITDIPFKSLESELTCYAMIS